MMISAGSSGGGKSISLSAKASPVFESNLKAAEEVAATTNSTLTNIKPKNDVTIVNLTMSLINLFDRVKCTLYNLINQECK